MERLRMADDHLMSVRRLLCTLLVGAGLATGSVVASAESPQIADDAISSRASAVQLADRVRTPTSSGLPRPRIFMALHGMNQVANNSSLDSQWRFVQSNLDVTRSPAACARATPVN